MIRSFLEKLNAVASLVYLKVTYHDREGKPITISATLEEANQIKELILKDILALLRKKAKFEWTPDYEDWFEYLKKTLSTSPVLTRSLLSEKLYLYLAVTEEAMSVVLMRESDFSQNYVYFISKDLKEEEK
ncbi:hypothetical protein KIW84_024114 [Lathyrus oleraceus]|uniref:Reverse transcriptase/retrotransposon-derived protein RNase H-like domain-containing protein n=1 Tax=Pisum sativum TaxID=3888 RepID=A0A9D4YGT9_PEA|nr:hypothetical protein KIW84_024114 [Pisum sativum]